MYQITNNLTIAGLIPAAGMSRRMGDFKPLMNIDGRTVIECVVDNMLSASINEIVVVLGHRGEEIRKVLERSEKRKGKLRFAYNSAYEKTHMLDSIQCGLQEIDSCDWFFITPGDMPAISPKTYDLLLEEASKTRKKIVFPTVDGYRKHPPLISGSYINDISVFRGNGLREYWSFMQEEIAEVRVFDRGCTMDMDLTNDYRKICHYMQSEYGCHSLPLQESDDSPFPVESYG